MQDFQLLFNSLLNDIRVELSDEFDRNFERKAFFNTSWKPAIHNTIGSLLLRTGALRSSIHSAIESNNIIWTSTLAYADIQNEGGEIMVTQKMKGFFWYRYRMATGGDYKNVSAESEFWKAMALKNVGSIIKIEKRQFIGNHPQVEKIVKDITTEWFNNDVKAYIDEQLKGLSNTK